MPRVNAPKTSSPPRSVAPRAGSAAARAASERAARARKSSAKRALRQTLIAPSDEVMQRLARAGTLAGEEAPKARRKKGEAADPKPEIDAAAPRGKSWKYVCGKCGTNGAGYGAAAVCTCGAIAYRAS